MEVIGHWKGVIRRCLVALKRIFVIRGSSLDFWPKKDGYVLEGSQYRGFGRIDKVSGFKWAETSCYRSLVVIRRLWSLNGGYTIRAGIERIKTSGRIRQDLHTQRHHWSLYTVFVFFGRCIQVFERCIVIQYKINGMLQVWSLYAVLVYILVVIDGFVFFFSREAGRKQVCHSSGHDEARSIHE